MTTQPDTLMIGAGIGGLSAAIRLAADGHHVTVYEANPQVGGKMSEITAAGFRWDAGPSVITMRHVLADLFHAAGRRLEDYLTLDPVEPLTRYFYPDGTVLDASRDISRMASQIEALEPRDVEGYLAYLAYAARIHRITGPQFIYNDPPSIAGLLINTPPTEWLAVDPLRTMHGAIRSFVRTPHLRQLLGRFATYVGADPYRAPATLNVIAHVEMTGGVWYPRGGIYTIAEALRRVAEELGVIIETNCRVEGIEVAGDRVRGVRLADGRTMTADAVIANVDVQTVYRDLLPDLPAVRRERAKLDRLEPSVSGFVMLLGVRGTYDRLAHHNIFFSRDYRAEFRDIFDDGLPPSDPTIYITATSKTDPDHAPAGHENWFVLVNAPPLSDRYNWGNQADAYAEHVLDVLAGRDGIDVRDQIVVQQVLTPREIASMSGAWRGALYGTSSNDRMAAFRRPPNRSEAVRGLYFAGGTVHPGGGVPMVMLSGAAAARSVMGKSGQRPALSGQ